MAFATDRDLLALEPRLFVDLAWLGQRVFSGTVAVSGTAAIVSGFDLVDAGVSAGDVLVLGGAGYEIVEVASAAQMVFSVLRGDAAGPVVAPLATSGPGVISTFQPQLELVHHQVLRMAGIEPGSADESAVTNAAALRLVESLGALHLIFAAVSAGGRVAGGLEERAEMYRRRFAGERQRASVMLDLDGDGEAEVERRLNVAQFVRG